jgi:hypothetical protein
MPIQQATELYIWQKGQDYLREAWIKQETTPPVLKDWRTKGHLSDPAEPIIEEIDDDAEDSPTDILRKRRIIVHWLIFRAEVRES